MASSDIPLSKGNIRQLITQLNEFKRQLKEDIPTEVERAVGAQVAEKVIMNVPTDLRDLDGNYLGTVDAAASVTVEKGYRGHNVMWRGEQIAFVEFGTGAAGAGSPYGGVMSPGYRPDPTKAFWVYQDTKFGNVLSRGLAPQAPLYGAAMQARSAGWLKQAAQKIVEARGRDAITLR
jgi:hypothetical protein